MANETKKSYAVKYTVSAYWDEGEELPEDMTESEIKERARIIGGNIIVDAIDEDDACEQVSDLWENNEKYIVDYCDIMGAGLTELDIDQNSIKVKE